MQAARHVLVCLTLALALAGCGSALPSSVTGQVVFPDKAPVTGGLVVFEPADTQPFAAQGVIQRDGRFRLGTSRPGEGAHPGKYKVWIEQYDDVEPIDPRFSDANTSGLEFTVGPGANDFTITVEKLKK
jgi:hypothetical protein